MREINASELSKILKEHKKWIDTGGTKNGGRSVFRMGAVMEIISDWVRSTALLKYETDI